MIGSPFLKQKQYSADYTPAGTAKQCRKEKGRDDGRKKTSTLSTLSTYVHAVKGFGVACSSVKRKQSLP